MYRALSYLAACGLIVLASGKGDMKPGAGYGMTLDAAGNFNLSWNFTGNKADDMITFTVEVETTGWVGLGFSPTGSMAGADIIVAWVRDDGAAYLQDMMADFNGLPFRDGLQDVQLLSANEHNGKTTVTFSRQLDTCDFEDLPLKTDTTRLIYAYSSADPSGGNLTFYDYHGPDTRGSKSVYLFDPQSTLEAIPEGALFYDVITPEYEVPSNDTTYYCTFHNAPSLSTKHHLIAVEPLITRGNEGLVHHMLLYACSNVTQEHMRSSNKSQGICNTDEMPEFAESCKSLVYAWAVGGGGYAYPEGTGYPLGGEDSPEYFLMETHYDNPAMKSGIMDASGAKLIYTPDLRDIDIGVISLGAVEGLFIPPKSSGFEVTTYCYSNCTNQWIPPEGITVFNYGLHSHLLGVKLQIDIYRADGTAEFFAGDNNYDFNFQEYRLFPKSKKIYPGDTLKLTCTMDSSDRTEVTLGGLSTREEMCYAFLSYYPRAPIGHCGTVPGYQYNPYAELYAELNAEVVSSDYDVDIRETVKNVNWNSDLVHKAQAAVNKTFHIDVCLKHDGSFYEPSFGQFDVTKYNYSLTEPGYYDTDNRMCVSSAPRLAVLYLVAALSSILTILI